MRLGELEGKGHCAKSEGITDTAGVVLIPRWRQSMRDKLAYSYCKGYKGGRGKREAGSCEGTEKSEDGVRATHTP